MAGGEAEGYERGGRVDGLSKEVRGEGICAECIEHVVGLWLAQNFCYEICREKMPTLPHNRSNTLIW